MLADIGLARMKEFYHLCLCYPDSPIIGVQAYLCRSVIGVVYDDIVHRLNPSRRLWAVFFYAIFAAAVEEEANVASFSAMRAARFVNPSQYPPSVSCAPLSDRARIPPSRRVPMG